MNQLIIYKYAYGTLYLFQVQPGMPLCALAAICMAYGIGGQCYRCVHIHTLRQIGGRVRTCINLKKLL